jgi:transcription termination/antitermination protein NusA
VQAVVQELQGEKIDIIPWSEDAATFVVNALQPATVSQGGARRGRRAHRGGGARRPARWPSAGAARTCASPASSPAGTIDIMTEQERARSASASSSNAPRCSRKSSTSTRRWPAAGAEGFAALEEVAYVDQDEIAGSKASTRRLAAELQSRAQEALDRREEAHREERRELGVEDALARCRYLTEQMLVTLGKAGIKTLDDLADLATDEQGNEIIMAARAHWFEDEEPASAEEDAVAADSQ